MRNNVNREERLWQISYSGVSHRCSQYFRVAVSRPAGFRITSFPKYGAEVQNTLVIGKSSFSVNPRSGHGGAGQGGLGVNGQ